jgi:hypothetical protein
MQTTNRVRPFGIPFYVMVVALMLASAVAGALAGNYLDIRVPSIFSGSHAQAVEASQAGVQFSPAAMQQEQRDLRLAAVPESQQAQILSLKESQLGVQIPAGSSASAPTQQQSWQEHLDLLSASRGSVPPQAAGSALSAYQRYWAAKAGQIK